jgi:hypothetical protein
MNLSLQIKGTYVQPFLSLGSFYLYCNLKKTNRLGGEGKMSSQHERNSLVESPYRYSCNSGIFWWSRQGIFLQNPNFNNGVTRELIFANLGWFFGFIAVGITNLCLKIHYISSRPLAVS